MINKKYIYFAIDKDNKILDGWELVETVETLKYYARLDMKENGYKQSEYKLISKANIIKQGLNPFDIKNWKQSNI